MVQRQNDVLSLGLYLVTSLWSLLDFKCAKLTIFRLPYAACTDDLYTKTSSVVEYYERFVLGNQDSSWDNFGYPRWQSVLALGIITKYL
jgi:hypothetical protein